MWVPVILSALVSALPIAPRVAVVPLARPGLLEPAQAARVEALVRASLEQGVALQSADETRAGLTGEDPVRCESNRGCFALLGKVLGVWAVVRVEAAEVAGDLSVVVQAIDSKTAEEIAEEHFTVASDAFETSAGPRLAALTARLKLRAPAAAVADAPVEAKLVPSSRPEPPAAVTAAPRAHRGPAVPLAAGLASVALAGTAVGFFAMGLDARTCLSGAPVNGQPTVCVPQSQVVARQQQANTGLVVGSVASALAVGLAATAIVLWVTD